MGPRFEIKYEKASTQSSQWGWAIYEDERRFDWHDSKDNAIHEVGRLERRYRATRYIEREIGILAQHVFDHFMLPTNEIWQMIREAAE